MRLLLIRHAESSANAEGRLQGRLDYGLSERGRAQSAVLAERLAALEVVALYTSPLLRARETAGVVALRLGTPIEERAGLMERDVGDLAGLTREEVRARYPQYVRARLDLRDVDVPGFEQDEAFAERVRIVTDEIIESHAAGAVAVMTHGGIIAGYLRQTLGIPIVRPGPFAVDNASVSSFQVHRNGVDGAQRHHIQLITLNDTCHLDGFA